jgi:hypothetical protein
MEGLLLLGRPPFAGRLETDRILQGLAFRCH